MTFPELELADWRRRVAGLYEQVRADYDAEYQALILCALLNRPPR